jgi:hypothetical protein
MTVPDALLALFNEKLCRPDGGPEVLGWRRR